MKGLRAGAMLLAGTIAFLAPFLTQERVQPGWETQPAWAQDEWKKEFEEICSRTDDAMSFSKEELRGLIARCDKVKSIVETLDPSTRKVYLRRLQLCRDLYAFVLESKEKN
jgi:hypothetical protein